MQDLTEILDRLERRIGKTPDAAEMPVEVGELRAIIAEARRCATFRESNETHRSLSVQRDAHLAELRAQIRQMEGQQSKKQGAGRMP